MGLNNNNSQSAPSTPKPASNDFSAEKTAQTAPAAQAPAPLLNLNMTDPAALELVRKRVLQAKAKQGRNSLVIPLSPAATGAGGIAIPQ